MTDPLHTYDYHLPCDCVTDDQRKSTNYLLDDDPLGAVKGMINALAITFGAGVVIGMVVLIWVTR